MANERADAQTGTKREVRPWTVMVYMAAGDSAEMDDFAVRDLREMQQGANEHVHVAVQIKRHWPDIPQRYVVSRNGRSGKVDLQSAVDPDDSDMGAGGTLTNFLEWVLHECPAHHYMLVLWGHAYGLGFGRDHGDPLQLSELGRALDVFSKKRTELERKRLSRSESKKASRREAQRPERTGILDILGTNACAMSYVEAAYELRHGAKYLLASQISVPFAGWPYDEVLESITKTTTPEQLGSSVIDSYVTGLNNPLTGERVQMSLLDLSHANALRESIDHLAGAIRGAFKSDSYFDSNRRAAIRDTFLAAAAGDVRPLVDLKDLSRGLKRDLCDQPGRGFVASNSNILLAKRRWLESSAQRLEQQLNGVDRMLAPQAHQPDTPKGLVVKTAAHPSLATLGGVGIYVPFVTDEQDLKRLGLEDDLFRSRTRDSKSETSRASYEHLALFSENGNRDGRGTWPALVYDDLNEPIPSELVDLIADIGVTSSSDRAEIAQMVLSIESTFNKLDRVLEIAQDAVTEALRQEQSNAHKPDSVVNRPPLRLMALANQIDKAGGPPVQVSEPTLLEWFRKLEAVVEEVERTTKKGLTQARFGLGPVTSPSGFNLDNVPPKTGEGAPGRDDPQGFNAVPPKTGEGLQMEFPTLSNPAIFDRNAELGPAFRLFSRAAEALRRLEQAASELERRAGQSLGKEVFERRALGLRQAFGILCETATSARRTIRRVIANPSYGLGPGAAAFNQDDREELANAAGMGARNLLLLSVDPLAPEPDEGELIIYEQALKSARAHAGRVDAPVPLGK